MPWVGFEHTIPASERAKTVHALDCSATVNGSLSCIRFEIYIRMTFLISAVNTKITVFWGVNAV
jgi:hypothetical protein